MAATQSVGAAGELIAQARLLMRGWTVGNVNSGGMMNAPAIDLLAQKRDRKISIAVKTTGHGSSSVQWGAKPGWTSLFKGDTPPDFVIFVWFTSPSAPDTCRVFVVPAAVVDADVHATHTHWHSQAKRDGSRRKEHPFVVVNWAGVPSEGNIGRDFATRWKAYEDAWHLLEEQPHVS